MFFRGVQWCLGVHDMKKGFSVLAISIIGALLLVVIGGSFYIGTKFNQMRSASIPVSQEEKEPLLGGDRDSHGCIGSAGYTWCEEKQRCLRVWEEACESIPNTPSIDETSIIIEAMRQAIVAKRGTSAQNLKFTVSKIMGKYAQGGASAEGGGAMWFASKENGKWTLIWDGNGVILCSDIAQYPDLPSVMVPECYDETTSSSVTR
jgi:hypothetical protein